MKKITKLEKTAPRLIVMNNSIMRVVKEIRRIDGKVEVINVWRSVY